MLNVVSEWLCSECLGNEYGRTEHSLHLHSRELWDALCKSHRTISPQCLSQPNLGAWNLDPVQWPGFLQHLRHSVQDIENIIKNGKPVAPVVVAVTKNEIVCLDVALGTDSASLEIGRHLEGLRIRLAALEFCLSQNTTRHDAPDQEADLTVASSRP
jgi:hypothetical protein